MYGHISVQILVRLHIKGSESDCCVGFQAAKWTSVLFRNIFQRKANISLRKRQLKNNLSRWHSSTMKYK